LGVAVLVAPEQITSRWLGEGASNPLVVDLARGLGARDLALGAATLLTIDDKVIGPRIQAACAVADVADTLATVAARKALPLKGVIGTVAVAGATAAASFYFSHKLAHS
jgi:hypothetical protein